MQCKHDLLSVWFRISQGLFGLSMFFFSGRRVFRIIQQMHGKSFVRGINKY